MSIADSHTELPDVVKAAVTAAYPKGKVGSTKHKELSLMIYDIEVVDGDRRLELHVAQDGTIVAVDQEIARERMSKGAAATLAKEAGEAKLTELARVTRRAKLEFAKLAEPELHYDVAFERDGRPVKLTIRSDGTILSREEGKVANDAGGAGD